MKITLAESPQETHDRIVGTLTAWKSSMDAASKSSRDARKALEEAVDREIWKVTNHPTLVEWIETVCGITERWFRALMRTSKMIEELHSMNYFMPDHDRINIEEIEYASANTQSALAKTSPEKRPQVWREAKAATNGSPVRPKDVQKAAAKVNHRKATVTVSATTLPASPIMPAIGATAPALAEDPSAKAVIARLTTERDDLAVKLEEGAVDYEQMVKGYEEEITKLKSGLKAIGGIGPAPKTGPLNTAKEYLVELGNLAVAMVDRVPAMAEQGQLAYGNLVLSGAKDAMNRAVARLVNRKGV